MGVLEYSYERHMQVIQDESYNNGFNNGFDSGFNNGFDSGVNTGHNNGVKDTTELFSWLKSNGRASDVLTSIDDSNFLSQLFTEYEIWKSANDTSGTNS